MVCLTTVQLVAVLILHIVSMVVHVLGSAHVIVPNPILEEFASTMTNVIPLHVRIMAHVQLISILTLFNSTRVLVLMVHLVSTVKPRQVK